MPASGQHGPVESGTVPAMKKVIVIIVVLALAAFAVKKLQDAA